MAMPRLVLAAIVIALSSASAVAQVEIRPALVVGDLIDDNSITRLVPPHFQINDSGELVATGVVEIAVYDIVAGYPDKLGFLMTGNNAVFGTDPPNQPDINQSGEIAGFGSGRYYGEIGIGTPGAVEPLYPDSPSISSPGGLEDILSISLNSSGEVAFSATQYPILNIRLFLSRPGPRIMFT